MRSFVDAVNSSIDSQYKWWPSVELSRRLLILAIMLPFPGNNVCQSCTYTHKKINCMVIFIGSTITDNDVNICYLCLFLIKQQSANITIQLML